MKTDLFSLHVIEFCYRAQNKEGSLSSAMERGRYQRTQTWVPFCFQRHKFSLWKVSRTQEHLLSASIEVKYCFHRIKVPAEPNTYFFPLQAEVSVSTSCSQVSHILTPPWLDFSALTLLLNLVLDFPTLCKEAAGLAQIWVNFFQILRKKRQAAGIAQVGSAAKMAVEEEWLIQHYLKIILACLSRMLLVS